MSVYYRFLYQFGITPWEADPAQGPAAEQVSTLFDREEDQRERPYGRALDLGCGTGIWSINLAERAWQVTGVDVVPKAIRRARERAKAAGADARDVYAAQSALPGWLRKMDLRFYRLRQVDSGLVQDEPAG